MTRLIIGVLLAVLAIVISGRIVHAQTTTPPALQASRTIEVDVTPQSTSAPEKYISARRSTRWQGRSLSVQVGEYEGYRNFAIGFTPAALWQHAGRSREELVPEVAIGFSDYDGHVFDSRNRLWHVGASPFFRWYCAPRSYLEAGVGPNLFTRSFIGNHILSTHLQFGDSIGFAHRFTDTLTLGLRITHFSNAGFKRPNDGVSFVQLVASYTL